MLTQWRALDRGIKKITPELIRSVAKDRLTLIRPALEALRSGKKYRFKSLPISTIVFQSMITWIG